MGPSDLQYFDKQTGHSDHTQHIVSSDMNENFEEVHDTLNERVPLLVAEPTSISYESVPESILHNNNIVADDNEPTGFYRKWNLIFYIFGGFILLFILMFLAGLLSLKFVIDSVEVSIDNIYLIESNESGVIINIENIDVNFQNPGMFRWVELMNENEIQLTENIIITNELNDQIFNISMDGENLYFNISRDNHWNFDLNNIFIQIDGNKLSSTLNNKFGLNVHCKLKVLGKNICLTKNINLDRDRLNGIIDQFIRIITDSLSIEKLQINEYNENIGFTGEGILSLNDNLFQNITIPKVSSMIGINIGNQFYELLNIDISNSTVNENKDIIEFNYTVFNIKKAIINSSTIDDIIWRILNDDSQIENFNFTINGKKSNDIGWIYDMWEDINLTLGMKIHSLFKKLYESYHIESVINKMNNLNMKTLSIGLEDRTGKFQVSMDFSSLIQFYLNKYHILFDGAVNFSGMNLDIDNILINKANPKRTDFLIRNTTVDIIDVEESRNLIQTILDNDIGFTDIAFGIESYITVISKFFDGGINLDGTLNMNIQGILTRILSNFSGSMNDLIEISDVTYIDGDSNFIKMSVRFNFNIPDQLYEINNNIKSINIGINYGLDEIFEIQIFSFKNINGIIPVNMEVILNTGNDKRREKIEEFIGGMLSGLSTNITISGIENESIYGCEKQLCELFEKIKIPFNANSNLIIGEGSGQNYFIRDTIMHIISKEVEMTLFNPISNRNLIIEIEEGEAICEGYIIGYLKEKIIWEVESGIWKSPRAKVEYANTGSAGWKIIENAIRGDGIINNMTVRAVVKVHISDSFGWTGLNILYKSTGHTNGKVRW